MTNKITSFPVIKTIREMGLTSVEEVEAAYACAEFYAHNMFGRSTPMSAQQTMSARNRFIDRYGMGRYHDLMTSLSSNVANAIHACKEVAM